MLRKKYVIMSYVRVTIDIVIQCYVLNNQAGVTAYHQEKKGITENNSHVFVAIANTWHMAQRMWLFDMLFPWHISNQALLYLIF